MSKLRQHQIAAVSSARVGDMIKRSIVTAVLVGHANPCSTIVDYFHPADDEAGQFLKDYMLIGQQQLTLESFIKKWMPQLVDARLRTP